MPGWKPEGYSSCSPYLICDDAQAVLDFAANAFGATMLRRYENDDGSIMHAEFMVDDTVIMIGGAGGEFPAMQVYVHIYVPNVDEVYEAALAAGGESVDAPSAREGDPDKRGSVRGPGGNIWSIATQQ